MPGHLLYDFGDAARGLFWAGPENGNSRKVTDIDLKPFEAFVTGWKAGGLKMPPRKKSGCAKGWY